MAHKTPTIEQINKLITFCYDRFDLASSMANLGENPQRELDRVRAQRWAKRGDKFDKLRQWVTQ